MSWGKRRGVSTTSRIADQDRKIIGDRINLLMTQRRAVLCPWTIDKEEFLWSLFDSAVVNQVQYLAKHMPRVLVRDDDFSVHIVMGDKKRRLKVYLASPMPIPNMGWQEPSFKLTKSNQFYDEVVAWSDKFAAYTDDWRAVRKHADKVMSTANTLGQARRLWPELAEFFTRQQLDRAPMQKSSPLPEGCYEYEYGEGNEEPTRKLDPCWEPGFVDPLNMLISEALMLPHPDVNDSDDKSWIQERVFIE